MTRPTLTLLALVAAGTALHWWMTRPDPFVDRYRRNER